MEQQLRKLGQEIRDARRMRGMSQRDLASAVGISPNTVVALERGSTGQPRKLEQVLAYLELDPPAQRAMPADVELVTRAIGIWLLGMDEDDRAQAVFRVLRAIADGVE